MCDISQSTCAVVRQMTSAKEAAIRRLGQWTMAPRSKNTPRADWQVTDFLKPPSVIDAVGVV